MEEHHQKQRMYIVINSHTHWVVWSLKPAVHKPASSYFLRQLWRKERIWTIEVLACKLSEEDSYYYYYLAWMQVMGMGQTEWFYSITEGNESLEKKLWAIGEKTKHLYLDKSGLYRTGHSHVRNPGTGYILSSQVVQWLRAMKVQSSIVKDREVRYGVLRQN